jgi:hypothetical protein
MVGAPVPNRNPGGARAGAAAAGRATGAGACRARPCGLGARLPLLAGTRSAASFLPARNASQLSLRPDLRGHRPSRAPRPRGRAFKSHPPVSPLPGAPPSTPPARAPARSHHSQVAEEGPLRRGAPRTCQPSRHPALAPHGPAGRRTAAARAARGSSTLVAYTVACTVPRTLHPTLARQVSGHTERALPVHQSLLAARSVLGSRREHRVALVAEVCRLQHRRHLAWPQPAALPGDRLARRAADGRQDLRGAGCRG